MRQVNYGPKFKEEIADLEAKLAQKKQEAIQAGKTPPEKEMISETLREQVRLQESSSTSENVVAAHTQSDTSNISNLPASGGHSNASDDESEAAKHQLETLLSHAFDKGIFSAMKEARKTNSPYLVDKLHDELVDHFYQQLLSSGQIKPE